MCIYTHIYVNLKDNIRIVQGNICIFTYIAITQILKQLHKKRMYEKAGVLYSLLTEEGEPCLAGCSHLAYLEPNAFLQSG